MPQYSHCLDSAISQFIKDHFSVNKNYICIFLFLTFPIVVYAYKMLQTSFNQIKSSHFVDILYLSIPIFIFTSTLFCKPYLLYILQFCNIGLYSEMMIQNLMICTFFYFIYKVFNTRETLFFWIWFSWKVLFSFSIFGTYLYFCCYLLD